MTKKIKPSVHVVYTHYPHYRQPVFHQLAQSAIFSFSFHYDSGGIENTILSGEASQPNHYQMRTRKLGPLLWQSKAVSLALRGDVDAFIFLGNPFIITTWLSAIIARWRGIPILFWTHGWIKDEYNFKNWLRGLFYRLADRILLYGERARRLGLNRGFPSSSLRFIGNSLDYPAQSQVRRNILNDASCSKLLNNDQPYFLVVARLVESAKVDIAIDALSMLNDDVALIVIGDGPSRANLENLARAKNVDVRFKGAIYSEYELALHFINSVAVVSPGKVGLLAMHALAYGAIVITHGDPDQQMPEFEALQDGVTGAFFNVGDADSLANVMRAQLSDRLDETRKAQRSAAGIAMIETRYTPQRQMEFIEAALLDLGVAANV